MQSFLVSETSETRRCSKILC